MSPTVGLAFHGSFDTLRSTAVAVEEAGGGGFFVSEADHDAFVMLGAAVEPTREIALGTSVAIAFARTPMSLAYTAHDLHRLSGGRLVLGLGTQIAPHVVKRFGMPWSRPAARMEEYVAALRAIWTCWQDGTRLAFEGDFYTHTLMPRAFSPGPLDGPPPPVWLAAVGPAMVDVAARVADGLILHPMTTATYRDEVVRPRLGGRPLTLAAMAMVATGRTEEELAASVALARRQIAFYASTPAYLPVLEHHGWADLHRAAHDGMRRGDYDRLGDLVDDEVLAAFAVVGDAQQVADEVLRRYAAVDRVVLSLPFQDSGGAVDVLALTKGPR